MSFLQSQPVWYSTGIKLVETDFCSIPGDYSYQFCSWTYLTILIPSEYQPGPVFSIFFLVSAMDNDKETELKTEGHISKIKHI